MHSINIQPSFSIQYIDNIQIDPFSTFQYHQKLCVMKDLAALWIMSIVCIHHCLITRGLALVTEHPLRLNNEKDTNSYPDNLK